MQSINEHHKQQAKRDKRDAIVIGALFGIVWLLSAALIFSTQAR